MGQNHVSFVEKYPFYGLFYLEILLSDCSCFNHCLVEAPNPLVVPLESSSVTKARRTKLWFSQAEVRGILGRGEGESGECGGEGEGEEMERAVEAFKKKGGQLWERQGGRQAAENDKVARELGLLAVYVRLILCNAFLLALLPSRRVGMVFTCTHASV